MRNTTSAIALAAGLFIAVYDNLAAQAPVTVHACPTARSASHDDAAAATAATMTIVGCLKEEKDVAGLKPNVAERVGITEDYILTSVKAAPGSSVSGLAARRDVRDRRHR